MAVPPLGGHFKLELLVRATIWVIVKPMDGSVQPGEAQVVEAGDR